MGVNVVKLEDVCEFYRGLTYSKKDESTFSDNIVLRASNIDLDTSTLILDDLKYLKEDFVIPNDKKLQKDCIFICMSSGSKSHLGKVAYIDRDYNYAFGGFMGLIKPKTNILPRYLFYLLQTPEYKELIKKLSNGININNIKFSDLKEFQFELPSLEEQEKALNILDKADEIRAKKKLANDKLDEFLKSTFISMFGDPVKNDKEYQIKQLKDITDKITDGSHNPPKPQTEGEIMISSQNITNEGLDLKNIRYITPDDFIRENKRTALEDNDILLTIVGTVGRCTVYNSKSMPKVVLQRSVAVIKPKVDNVNSKYLKHLVLNNSFQFELQKKSKGVAQVGIYLNDLKMLNILVPPIEDQNKFAQIVEKVEAQKQKNELVIEQMNNLFNSLSQRAFKGEL